MLLTDKLKHSLGLGILISIIGVALSVYLIVDSSSNRTKQIIIVANGETNFETARKSEFAL